MASRFTEAWGQFQAHPGEESFEPLYETSKALVYTICYRILRNREDAGDALQNTFARLLVLARDPSSLKTMPDLDSVIRRLAVLEADSLRKRRGRCAKREILMNTPPDRPGADLPPDRIAAAHELRDRIETLVSTLPERQRLPILLHFFHGMTQAEIAQALDRPVRTVSDQIAAGLKRLRPLMLRAGLGEATLVFAALIGASEWLHPPAAMAAHVVFAKSLVLAQGMGAGGLGAGAGVIPTGGTGLSLIHFIHWGGITMKAKLGLSVVAAVLIAAGVFVSVQLRENPRERAAQRGWTSPRDTTPGGLGTAGPSLAAEAVSGKRIAEEGGGTPLSGSATPSSATIAARVAPAPSRETESMTIQGCVTDESGLPIAGAHVAAAATFRTFWPDTPTSGTLVATSQPDGRYTLSGINRTTGLLGLAAGHPDYGMREEYLSLADGDFPPAVNFVLSKGFTLKGHVLRKVHGVDGGLADRLVEVNRYPFENVSGRTIFRRMGFGKTQADGSFEIRNLPYDAGMEVRVRDNPDETDLGQLGFPLIRVASGGQAVPMTLRLRGITEIAGRVLDPEGRPVAGAEIRPGSAYKDGEEYGHGPLTRDDSRKTVSGSQGEFRLSRVGEGSQYDLRVRAEGFLEKWVSRVRAGDRATSIVLDRGFRLAGQVVEEASGKPVAGVQLTLLSSLSSPFDSFPGLSQAVTASDGTFEFTAIKEGTYSLGGSSPPASLPAYAVRAVHGIVLSREKPSARLPLVAVPACAIRGRILDAEKRSPVEKAFIRIWNTETNEGHQARSKADGRFEIQGLAAGTYGVNISASGYSEICSPGEMHTMTQEDRSVQTVPPIELQAASREIEFLMAKGGTIRGSILTSKGDPLKNQFVSIERAPDPKKPDEEYWFRDIGISVKTGASGAFEINGLSTDHRSYRICVHDRVPLARSEYVMLTPEKPTAEVLIRLPKPAAIEGAVRDDKGNPVPGAGLMAVLNPEPGENTRTSSNSGVNCQGQTDQGGHYRLDDVAPGSWRVSVAYGAKQEFSTVDEIWVKEGETVTGVDFTGVPDTRKGVIRGVVADLRGQPACDWYVKRELAGKPGEYVFELTIATSRDGRFELKGVGKGKYRLEFGRYNPPQNIQCLSAPVEASDEERPFVLPIGGVLRGRVVDGKTGQPLRDARITLEASPDSYKTPIGNRVELSRFSWDSPRSVPVDSNGEFTIPELPVARYRMVIRSATGAFEKQEIENVVIDGSLGTNLGDIKVPAKGN
jgi:RNA polymerase sigma-70 factor (ECF subfamily)